jgi:hypothetical protein
MRILIKCPCGEKFYTYPSRKGRKKYCSLACKYKYAKRPSGLKYNIRKENHAWFKKGHKPWNTGNMNPYFDKSIGYWKVSVNGKEIKYHRHIMEKEIGRKLTEEEVVHHIDGDKNNNEPENLYLFPNKSEHLRFHWATTRR